MSASLKERTTALRQLIEVAAAQRHVPQNAVSLLNAGKLRLLVQKDLDVEAVLVRTTYDKLVTAGVSEGAAEVLKMLFPSPTEGMVRAREVVASTYNWSAWETNSSSSSSISRKYKGAKRLHTVIWELNNDAVKVYLDRTLQGIVLPDPRDHAIDYSHILYCESDGNWRFQQCVGRTVERVAAEVLRTEYPELQWTTMSVTPAGKEQGIPDFSVKYRQDGSPKELFVGEGKTPHVLISAHKKRPSWDDRPAGKCMEQICDYMLARGLKWGFLTCVDATYGIERQGDHKYAVTRALLPDSKDPTVAELLLYMVLKQAETPKLQMQAVAGPVEQAVPIDSEQPQPGEIVGGSGFGNAAPRRRSARLQSLAESFSPSQQQQQQQRCYPNSALQLSDECLGVGQSGPVRVGRLHGAQVAVKMADVQKEQELVERLQHEAACYERMAELQGSCIPRLLGYGYWQDIYFVATSVVSGGAPDGSMRAALPLAVQALTRVHSKGLLHGDVSHNNVRVNRLADDTWQVWLLDFSNSSDDVTPHDCELELAEMRRLFRVSEGSSATDLETPYY